MVSPAAGRLKVNAAQRNERGKSVTFLLITMVLGLTFLGIKGIEYSQKIRTHLFQGVNFQFVGPNSNHVQMFFVLHFLLTGFYVLHLTIGVGVLSVITAKAYRGQFSDAYYTPAEVGGLYWQLVDIVWIFLYPLLYMIKSYG